jgi:hypothetical protein
LKKDCSVAAPHVGVAACFLRGDVRRNTGGPFDAAAFVGAGDGEHTGGLATAATAAVASV